MEKPKHLGNKFERSPCPQIGNKYHLSWANYKCVWKLIKFIDSEYCILETPKTKKQITAKIDDLRLLSKLEPKNCYKPN